MSAAILMGAAAGLSLVLQTNISAAFFAIYVLGFCLLICCFEIGLHVSLLILYKLIRLNKSVLIYLYPYVSIIFILVANFLCCYRYSKDTLILAYFSFCSLLDRIPSTLILFSDSHFFLSLLIITSYFLTSKNKRF